MGASAGAPQDARNNPLPSTRLAVMWTNALLSFSGIAFILLQIYTVTSVRALKRAGLPYRKYLVPWIVGFWPIIGAILIALLVRDPTQGTDSGGSTTVVQPKASPVTLPAADIAPNPLPIEGTGAMTRLVLDRTTDILAKAYQTHNTAWLQYYYTDAAALVHGNSGTWQLARIPTYPGAAQVSYSPSSIYLMEMTRSEIVVRYTLTIGSISYKTQQTLTLGTVPGVATPIWRVNAETAPYTAP